MADDIKRAPAVDLSALSEQNADADDQLLLAALDEELHRLWGLGRNLILAWAASGRGVDVLVVPHYTLISFAGIGAEEDGGGTMEGAVIEELMTGSKHLSPERLVEVARTLDYKIQHIDLPFVPGVDLSDELIEGSVKRFSIGYCEDRAVALFDIVGFGLLSPLEQVTQLNSLAYSLNSAYAKLLKKRIDISFARTTTGDGFYIWNRDRSVQANVNLYHFMHLVLADNAIARRKSKFSNMTPLLRTCFHIGGHYEFYQSEGLSPTIYSYIVGDVTIELARMSERAVPGQVLVGDFLAPMPDWITGDEIRLDTIAFIERTQATLSSLEGLVLSEDGIESIKCYLTGAKVANEGFGIKRYRISDKHGRTRDVYNAKVNIYRTSADPVFLGLQTEDLSAFEVVDEEFAGYGA